MMDGTARCMAHSGLKKALSFEAVRLASQERVQQRPLVRTAGLVNRTSLSK